jgi:hypothetical protein
MESAALWGNFLPLMRVDWWQSRSAQCVYIYPTCGIFYLPSIGIWTPHPQRSQPVSLKTIVLTIGPPSCKVTGVSKTLESVKSPNPRLKSTEHDVHRAADQSNSVNLMRYTLFLTQRVSVTPVKVHENISFFRY